MKIAKKRLRKSPKRETGKNSNKPWGTTPIIYTYHEGSYKV
jgi:hypothetical protein